MRSFLILTLIVLTTFFYSKTALVYSEGSFDGALVVKPYPMYAIVFGGGEDRAWARHHPGEASPWFMQKELRVISRFSWEEGGDPAWVSAYVFGFVATLLVWVALAVYGPVKLLIRIRARLYSAPLSIG